MPGAFVHQIDPILATVGGVHLWWYGLSYALGFLNAHLFLRRQRAALGLSMREVYDLTLCLVVGVLIGGRAVIVLLTEPELYSARPELIPALWLGGLATHGLIVGGATGVLILCLAWRRPFRPVFDALAIPAAIILGFGRIGNFIDGQIVGSVTGVPWAVQFPDTEGFRHPVVLYDGLKNFLLVPILLWARRFQPPPGRLGALFVFLYPALRIPIDLLREYPGAVLGLPAGQTFNLVMALAGAGLLVKSWWKPAPRAAMPSASTDGPGWRRVAFAACLAFVLVIPSDATRDVPERYGARHAGLAHSALYVQVP